MKIDDLTWHQWMTANCPQYKKGAVRLRIPYSEILPSNTLRKISYFYLPPPPEIPQEFLDKTREYSLVDTDLQIQKRAANFVYHNEDQAFAAIIYYGPRDIKGNGENDHNFQVAEYYEEINISAADQLTIPGQLKENIDFIIPNKTGVSIRFFVPSDEKIRRIWKNAFLYHIDHPKSDDWQKKFYFSENCYIIPTAEHTDYMFNQFSKLFEKFLNNEEYDIDSIKLPKFNWTNEQEIIVYFKDIVEETQTGRGKGRPITAEFNKEHNFELGLRQVETKYYGTVWEDRDYPRNELLQLNYTDKDLRHFLDHELMTKTRNGRYVFYHPLRIF